MQTTEIETYDYTDETGQLLYQNCRYNPKTFKQRRPDGAGDYIWDLNGTRRVLYRLPELLRADSNKWVFCCEGEKDVDNLIKLGLTATTAGAVHSWKPEFAEFLNDKKVCILPDNDKPGKDLAERITKDLEEAGCPDVRTLNLPDLKEKGDVTDWLEAGGTKEKLIKLIDQIKNCGLQLTTMDTVDKKPIEWFMDNKIPSGTLSMIVGDCGCGKSFLTTYIAAMVSSGGIWPDGLRADMGDTVFLNDEDSASIIRQRLEAHKANLSKIHIIDSEKGKFFDVRKHIKGLDNILSTTRCKLLVIDPITAYMGDVNANSNSEVRAALTPLVALAEKHNVTILAINHLNKKADLAHIYRGLGSTAFVAQSRSVWGVIKDNDDPDVRVFCPIKTNYSVNPTGLKFRLTDGAVEFESEPYFGDIDAKKDEGSTAEAAQWLREYILNVGSPGTDVACNAIYEDGKAAGFNRDLLWRAKTSIGVKPRKIGFGKESQWFWSLPDD